MTGGTLLAPMRGGPPSPSPAAWRTRLARHALWAAPVAVLLAIYAYPLWTVLQAAFDGGDAWEWAAGDYVRGRLQVALEQAVWSVLLTMAIALPLAWMHHSRRIAWSRFHLAMHAAPFVLPVFVVVFGTQALLGGGGWVDRLTGVSVFAAGPMVAVVVAHAYYNYGFAARLLHATLERRPYRLEEAARTLGSSPAAAFTRTTLPLLLPSVLAVALLVFFFSFTSFGVVLFMGGGEISTLETLLYRQLGGVRPRYERAAVLGLLQLAINVLVLGAYMALIRREAKLPRESARVPAPAGPQVHILAWATLALGMLPALAVLVGGFRVDGAWTLEVWRSLLDTSHAMHETGFVLWKALDRSLFYAVWTAGLSLALTAALAYGLPHAPRLLRRPLEVFAALPIGTSSLLIGFGYFFAFGVRAVGTALDLRGTLWIIVLAHTLVAFPFTARALIPALQQRDTRLDEAASVLGARPWDVVRRVHWPLLRGPTLAAVGLAIALSLGDFGASLLLMDPDNQALSIWIADHHDAFDTFAYAQAVALSGLLMVLAASAYLLVEAARPRQTWKREWTGAGLRQEGSA